MVKHTQIIRRQQSTNCLSVFDHFWGFVLKWLRLLARSEKNLIAFRTESLLKGTLMQI